MAHILCKCLLILATLVVHFYRTSAHGRLLDPIHRGGAFRKGFPTAPNWDDDANYCGGFMVHYLENGGKCGVCGDNYADERSRANENGGKYGTGVIVKTYKSGSVIPVTVEITANHLGHFTFDLCPLRYSSELESEECFEAHKLPLVADFDVQSYDKQDRYEYEVESSRIGEYRMILRLPEGLTCEHCVLRWQYTVGNSWGVCEDGTEALGCGNQETFRTCSDIKIQ